MQNNFVEQVRQLVDNYKRQFRRHLHRIVAAQGHYNFVPEQERLQVEDRHFGFH